MNKSIMSAMMIAGLMSASSCAIAGTVPTAKQCVKGIQKVIKGIDQANNATMLHSTASKLSFSSVLSNASSFSSDAYAKNTNYTVINGISVYTKGMKALEGTTLVLTKHNKLPDNIKVRYSMPTSPKYAGVEARISALMEKDYGVRAVDHIINFEVTKSGEVKAG